MDRERDTSTATGTDRASSTTQTLRGRPPSAIQTLAASPEALDALFEAPAPPPPRARRFGKAAPVVHPPATHVGTTDGRVSTPRPSALDTMAAPPVRPSALETMAAAPRPSVTAGPGEASPDETRLDPAATRAAAPASVLESESGVDGTMFRGSAGSPSDSAALHSGELSTPSALRNGNRPIEAPEGLDRNLALARLQERMLGVQPEAVKIGRFIVIRKLGQGAMGIVYLAYDPKLDRKVALKLVDTSALGSEVGDAQVRLEREAKAAAALGHPNVVTVYDVGNQGEDVFLAMEFVEGRSLTEWMKADHDWRSTVALFAEIARGLAAAHDADLVHRDFKPDNVLMGDDGRPRVADFGLARPTEGWSARDAARMLGDGTADSIRALAIGSQDALASTGEVCGTPAYMAPEQFAGIDVGPASDQFGFCASLFEALFGERPFKGQSVTELAVAVIENNRQPLPANHGVPKAVVDTVLTGLAPGARDRHSSMHVVADRLDAALRARTRNRMLAGGALLAVLGIGFGAQASQTLQAQPCEAAETALEPVWNEDRHERVSAALTDAELGTAGADHLAEFATTWTAQRVASCEATRVSGQQSDEVLLLRTACLDRMASRLDAAATALAQRPSADVLAAIDTALPSLNACEDVDRLKADQARFRDSSEATVEAQAAWVHASGLMAELALRAHEPPAAWRAAAEELRGIGDEHGLMQAQGYGRYWLGSAALAEGQLPQAIEHFETAMPSAAQSPDDRLLPNLLLKQAEALLLSERAADADAAAKLGLAMNARVRDDAERTDLQAKLTATRASIATARGAFEDGAALAREALQHPNLQPRVKERLHSTLGSACHQLQDHACAFEHHAKAMEIVSNLPDIEPLELAGRHANMGLMHAEAGDGPHAVETLGRAAEIVEKAFGADHPMRGQLLADRGGIQGAMMDPQDGERDLLAGLRIHVQHHGKDHPALVEALIDLTKTQTRLGKFDDAKRHGEWAKRIVDAAFEGQHPRRADPRLPLSDAYAALGQFDAAAEVVREGLQILDVPQTHPMQRAEFQFALARALAPADTDAARTAADEALAGIADFEPGAPLREAIQGWTSQALDPQPLQD